MAVDSSAGEKHSCMLLSQQTDKEDAGKPNMKEAVHRPLWCIPCSAGVQTTSQYRRRRFAEAEVELESVLKQLQSLFLH